MHPGARLATALRGDRGEFDGMTNDQDLELSVLERVADWDESPGNTPRKLDLTWQDAVAFFGLPAADPAAAEAAWIRLYAVLDPLLADGRLHGDLYMNRVRHLRPGYRGALALQSAKVAQLAAERAALDTEKTRANLQRDALAETHRRQDAARHALDEKSQALHMREADLTAAQGDLGTRAMQIDRDQAIARRETDAIRAAAKEELQAGRRVRVIGVLALTAAAAVGVWLAAVQGWV
jgi:hypothetical protein